VSAIGADLGRATLLARAVLSQTPLLGEWRRIVFASASFPENLSEVDAATVTTLPRIEAQLWERLKRRGGLRQDTLFGDYAIAHPVPTELDPRTMRMSASIRYTTAENWLILKGRNVRQYGFDQYFELCRTLVTRPEYAGEDYSWGDRFIARCARGAGGPGNATTWRKVGTNHHVTLVAHELASVPGA
jgi:Beta protein